MKIWDAIIWALALWGTVHARAAGSDSTACLPHAALTELTMVEKAELRDRLRAFYAEPASAAVMSAPVPKRDALGGHVRHSHAYLAGRERSRAAILSRGRAAVESDDKLETLAETWLTDLARDLGAIPTEGATERALWSDDYWRTKWGLSSYRYADKKEFATYKEAVAAYAQPADYEALLAEPSGHAARIARWSPAEKYDLTVGDARFALTLEQKGEGAFSLGPDGDVEEWMGICHGWAAASIMIPAPTRATEMVGARGTRVTWYPNDVRALASLMWANGAWTGNQAGGRCEAKKPETFPNGRIKQQECFDTNPATLHMALGNLIGRAKLAFVFDSAFDYEVWNQPVHSYSFTYFNPLKPEETSKDAAKVAVPYDAAFKAKDRFQAPLTRGVRHADGKYDDSGVAKVVGVAATVVYLDEITPEAKETPAADAYTRVTYTYDLELADTGGKLVPTGGEWHQNRHPDFLWLPRKDTVAWNAADSADVEFDGESEPAPAVTKVASRASSEGYPLCQVVRELVKDSAGEKMYRCAKR